MSVKLLSEQHLEFLSLKVGCTGSCESTHYVNTTLLEITCHSSYNDPYTTLGYVSDHLAAKALVSLCFVHTQSFDIK